MTKSVFLFPAFTIRYKGHETTLLEQYGIDLKKDLAYLSEITQTDLRDFEISQKNYLEEELQNQLMSYYFSCRFYDLLHKNNMNPAIVSGMSMGLYAALYAGGFYSYETGAKIIHKVFRCLQQKFSEKPHKMVAVVGLNAKDLNNIIKNNKVSSTVVIKNSDFSYVLAGLKEELGKLIPIALEEGALSVNMMPTSMPYHLSYVDILEKDTDFFHGFTFHTARYPLLSSVTQKSISSTEEIKKEVFLNISQPVNWQKSIHTLLDMGYSNFVECGAGDSLKRIAKFINGDFQLLSVKSVLGG